MTIEPVEINSRDDLEQFRNAYVQHGGCKLIHCSQFNRNIFENGDLYSHVRSWLHNDDPIGVNVDHSSDSDSFDLYTFAKFLWLAEDLRTNPQKIYPQGYINHNGIITIHPGSVKVSVMDLSLIHI